MTSFIVDSCACPHCRIGGDNVTLTVTEETGERVFGPFFYKGPNNDIWTQASTVLVEIGLCSTMEEARVALYTQHEQSFFDGKTRIGTPYPQRFHKTR